MDDDANRLLHDHGGDLADAIVAAVPGWIDRILGTRSSDAGRAAATALDGPLHELLAADVDAQRTNPLALVRAIATPHATQALRQAGVEPPRRSGFDAEHFPDDAYGLGPMTWRDIDESLHEPGILWGAIKAAAHRARHAGGS
jgi:hypothetical protein